MIDFQSRNLSKNFETFTFLWRNCHATVLSSYKSGSFQVLLRNNIWKKTSTSPFKKVVVPNFKSIAWKSRDISENTYTARFVFRFPTSNPRTNKLRRTVVTTKFLINNYLSDTVAQPTATVTLPPHGLLWHFLRCDLEKFLIQKSDSIISLNTSWKPSIPNRIKLPDKNE